MAQDHRESISAALKRLLKESPYSLTALEHETGIDSSVLSRFLTGRTSMRLDVVDRLGEFFGLALVKLEQKERLSIQPEKEKKMSGATTQTGYVNRNQQEVLGNTNRPGTDHMQYIYRLRCLICGLEYGANGSDIFQRKCPHCQGGRPGTPLG